MDYSLKEIKRKSSELSLPFSKVLYMYFLEELLERISQSELKDNLWLKAEDNPMDGSRKKITNRMIFYMKNIRREAVEKTLKEVLRIKQGQGYSLRWDILYVDEQIELRINIQADKIQMPFKIIVRPIDGKDLFPSDAEYVSPLNPEKKIYYKKYPTVLFLAECFFEIMDKLELIPSMGCYYRAYEILKENTIDGRLLQVNLKRLFFMDEETLAEKNWDMVREYKNYAYMRKRWESSWKGIKKDMPPWEEVIELLDLFFAPVWKAVLSDDIFFGDWMPYLGRYLD